MALSILIVALTAGSYYLYNHITRPLETVIYGSEAELKASIESLEKVKDGGRLSWREKYSLGVSYHQDRRYADAVVMLESFLEEKPETMKAYETLGMAYFRLDKLQEALDSWRKAKDLAGGAPSPLDAMIPDIERTLAVRDRISDLEKILKKDNNKDTESEIKPEEVSAKRFELALLYLGDNRVDDAVTELEALVKADKKSSDYHSALAQAYAVKGDFDKAYSSVSTALKLNPSDEELQKRKVELGRIKDAIKKGDFHNVKPQAGK